MDAILPSSALCVECCPPQYCDTTFGWLYALKKNNPRIAKYICALTWLEWGIVFGSTAN